MSGHAGAVDLAGTSIGGNIWMPIFVGTNGVLLGAMPIVAHLLGADKRDNIGKVIRHTIFGDSFFGSYHFNGRFIFRYPADTSAFGTAGALYCQDVYGGGGRRCDTVFMSTSLRALIDTLGHTGITMKIYLLALPVNAF